MNHEKLKGINCRPNHMPYPYKAEFNLELIFRESFNEKKGKCPKTETSNLYHKLGLINLLLIS